ncbi:MAG: hypothetical protein Q8P62_00150 [Candidatus Peregrinibacteria bacterium]|nr:hypothetical protein [Candidatus Peregrinibacteria bacterium]
MENKSGKFWVIAFLVLVIAGGYFGFAKYQMLWPFSPRMVVENPVTTTPITSIVNPIVATKVSGALTTLNSKLVNLSFKYPAEANYKEENLQATYGIKYTGKQINFSDSNEKYPDFDATSIDFTAEAPYPIDLINGNLDSMNSFSVTINQGYGITKELKPGIYFYAGYRNMECSHGTDAYLFVRPPKNSGLKYISFYLGANDEVDYSKDPIDSDPCSANPAVIKQGVKDLVDNKILAVKENLDKALAIAQTFE